MELLPRAGDKSPALNAPTPIDAIEAVDDVDVEDVVGTRRGGLIAYGDAEDEWRYEE